MTVAGFDKYSFCLNKKHGQEEKKKKKIKENEIRENYR